MKACAVPKCGNDSYRRPDLSYFSLPKATSVREEWIEILGVKSSNSSYVFVCELHFRAKDITTGKKKELKAHSVPVLRLGKGQADPIDSDDEFMTYGSDCDTEIAELNKSLTVSQKDKKTEQELIENHSIKQEPKPESECETGRRPSRRAAIVAAKKISNTVRSYSLKEDADFNANASVPPKPPVKTEKAQKRKKSPTPPPLPPPPPEPPIEIGLDMECEEEILSETQAETLSKAQSHYNLVMKGLRELVQCNVKVIQTGPFGTLILNPSPIPFQTIPVKNTVIPTSMSSQTNRVVIRTDAPRIIPVAHTVTNPQPSIIIM